MRQRLKRTAIGFGILCGSLFGLAFVFNKLGYSAPPHQSDWHDVHLPRA